MMAEILLDDGPATLRANRSEYNIETEKVAVIGPILFTGPEDYRLETHDVTADLGQRTLQSHGRVEGTMPLGRFSAESLHADLGQRSVLLSGNARLHIVQGDHR
jgi:lipopolysaccharide export system protein LptC